MQNTQITILGHRVQVASSEASGLLAKAEELQALAGRVPELLTALDAVHRNYAEVERQLSAIRQAADAASSVFHESSGAEGRIAADFGPDAGASLAASCAADHAGGEAGKAFG